MAWFPDWGDRLELLRRHGLPILITEARIEDDFVALYLQADEACLPRSHVNRNFPLHITLGYRQDYAEGVAEMLCEVINGKWAGRYHVVQFDWIGKGGGADIHKDDPIAQDEVLRFLHSNGHYGNGKHVRPRRLHISL